MKLLLVVAKSVVQVFESHRIEGEVLFKWSSPRSCIPAFNPQTYGLVLALIFLSSAKHKKTGQDLLGNMRYKLAFVFPNFCDRQPVATALSSTCRTCVSLILHSTNLLETFNSLYLCGKPFDGEKKCNQFYEPFAWYFRNFYKKYPLSRIAVRTAINSSLETFHFSFVKYLCNKNCVDHSKILTIINFIYKVVCLQPFCCQKLARRTNRHG